VISPVLTNAIEKVFSEKDLGEGYDFAVNVKQDAPKGARRKKRIKIVYPRLETKKAIIHANIRLFNGVRPPGLEPIFVID